jgi:hypothetical protein
VFGTVDIGFFDFEQEPECGFFPPVVAFSSATAFDVPAPSNMPSSLGCAEPLMQANGMLDEIHEQYAHVRIFFHVAALAVTPFPGIGPQDVFDSLPIQNRCRRNGMSNRIRRAHRCLR